MDGMSCLDFPESDTDISFVSSERPSSGRSSSVYDYIDVGRTSRVSTNSDRSFGSTRLGALKFNNPNSPDTSFSHESSATSFSYSLQSEVSEHFFFIFLYAPLQLLTYCLTELIRVAIHPMASRLCYLLSFSFSSISSNT